MRFLLPVLMLLLLPLQARGIDDPGGVTDIESANGVLEAAHLSFERGDYSRSLQWYLRVIEGGFETPSLWTNAGTAAWRAGRSGEAVLYYKRALKIDPAYNRALQSLDFVSPETNIAAESFTDEMMMALLRYSTPGQWFLAAQMLFLLGCLALAKALASRQADARGHWVAVLAWSFVFAIGTGFLGWLNHSARIGGNEVVVMVDGSVTRSAPSDDSTAQMELPAGTILEVIESPRRGFVRVRGADGSQGFISSDSITRI